ncbi:hypothetical protein R6Q59_020823 [Mikania micrantha]
MECTWPHSSKDDLSEIIKAKYGNDDIANNTVKTKDDKGDTSIPLVKHKRVFDTQEKGFNSCLFFKLIPLEPSVIIKVLKSQLINIYGKLEAKQSSDPVDNQTYRRSFITAYSRAYEGSVSQ